jgi:hypothetical protein
MISITVNSDLMLLLINYRADATAYATVRASSENGFSHLFNIISTQSRPFRFLKPERSL